MLADGVDVVAVVGEVREEVEDAAEAAEEGATAGGVLTAVGLLLLVATEEPLPLAPKTAPCATAAAAAAASLARCAPHSAPSARLAATRVLTRSDRGMRAEGGASAGTPEKPGNNRALNNANGEAVEEDAEGERERGRPGGMGEGDRVRERTRAAVDGDIASATSLLWAGGAPVDDSARLYATIWLVGAASRAHSQASRCSSAVRGGGGGGGVRGGGERVTARPLRPSSPLEGLTVVEMWAAPLEVCRAGSTLCTLVSAHATICTPVNTPKASPAAAAAWFTLPPLTKTDTSAAAVAAVARAAGGGGLVERLRADASAPFMPPSTRPPRGAMDSIAASATDTAITPGSLEAARSVEAERLTLRRRPLCGDVWEAPFSSPDTSSILRARWRGSGDTSRASLGVLRAAWGCAAAGGSPGAVVGAAAAGAATGSRRVAAAAATATDAVTVPVCALLLVVGMPLGCDSAAAAAAAVDASTAAATALASAPGGTSTALPPLRPSTSHVFVTAPPTAPALLLPKLSALGEGSGRRVSKYSSARSATPPTAAAAAVPWVETGCCCWRGATERTGAAMAAGAAWAGLTAGPSNSGDASSSNAAVGFQEWVAALELAASRAASTAACLLLCTLSLPTLGEPHSCTCQCMHAALQ